MFSLNLDLKKKNYIFFQLPNSKPKLYSHIVLSKNSSNIFGHVTSSQPIKSQQIFDAGYNRKIMNDLNQHFMPFKITFTK